MNRFTAGEMCNIWSCGATPIPEEGMGLVYAGPHIHVGGLSMELINADTGEQICYSEADYGKGEEARDEEGCAETAAMVANDWNGGAWQTDAFGCLRAMAVVVQSYNCPMKFLACNSGIGPWMYGSSTKASHAVDDLLNSPCLPY